MMNPGVGVKAQVPAFAKSGQALSPLLLGMQFQTDENCSLAVICKRAVQFSGVDFNAGTTQHVRKTPSAWFLYI
jgi:hypothetical protein